MNIIERIGKNIKFIRIKKGLSQKDIADKIEMDRSSIAYWESGKCSMSLDAIEKLAKAFDLPIGDLFKYDLEEEEKNKEKNEELIYFNDLLIKKGILNDNDKLTVEEYDKIIDFLKVSINFLIKKNDIK